MTSVSQYADDVGLYSTNRSMETAKKDVQTALDSVMDWCQKWQVVMNIKKSQVIVFTKCPQHKKQTVNLKMFGQIIPTSNDVTYLGVNFDCRLSWEHQINKICERAYSRLNLLRAMAHMSNQHNPTLLSQLYNSTIRSIWEYSCICIISAANCHLNKLQLLQNEALRIILRVPAYMPIARMNDAGNQENVIDHLRTTARARVEQFLEKSTLVKKTVDQFKNLKSDGFNISPLDKIEL